MIWRVLGIEETKDKTEIKKAYRVQLMSVNPEDKPEEFKQLRAAYEEAMKLADQEEVPAADKSPIDLWVDKLAAVYWDLDQRRSLEAWHELMSDELCVSLDTKPLIMDAMLKFMMENYRLPQRVWVYLNEIFSFTEIAEELYANYHPNFVNYVILDGIKYDDAIPYDMFPAGISGAECDEYIVQFMNIVHTNLNECGDEIEKLRSMSLHHPYGDAQVARYDAFKGDADATKVIADLIDAYPDDMRLKLEYASACQFAGKNEEAIEAAKAILEIMPEHQNAMRIMAFAYAELKNFRDAVDTINKLMDFVGGNRNRLYELIDVRQAWNDALVDQYIEKLEADPDDFKSAYDLTWCYLQNDKTDLAIALAPKLKESYPTDFKYKRLMFLLCYAGERHEDAIKAADALLEIGMGGDYDKDETPDKRKGYLSDAYSRKAHMLIELGRIDEAVAVLEQSLEFSPDDADLYSNTCYTYMHIKRYQDALGCAQKVMELMPESAHGYAMAANACFNMYRDNEAFQLVNTALDYDGSDLASYVLKLRILIRNGAYEPAQQLLDFLHENGITEDPTVNWCEAQLMDRTGDDKEAAYAKYQEVDSQLEGIPGHPQWAPEFYYMMACLLAEIKDKKKDYSRDDLLALLEKGLAADSDDFDCLEYKGWLLKREEHTDEALEIYHKLEQIPRSNTYIEKQLAELYYDKLDEYADKSLYYHNMIAETEDESRLYHLDVAYLNYRMKDFDEAEKHLMRTLEISPDDYWVYFRLAQVNIVRKNFEAAYDYALKSLELYRVAVKDPKERRAMYWTTLAQVLRLMNKPREAVIIYKECEHDVATFGNYFKEAFETYMTAGMYHEVEALMAEWKRKKYDTASYYGHEALYKMLRGDYKKAESLLKKYRGKMDEYHYDLVHSAVSANLYGFKNTVANRRDKLKTQQDAGKSNLCYEYSSLAIALWFNDEHEEAKEYAELAIAEYEKYLKTYDMYAPIYIGSASVAMAVAGRIDEARELVVTMDKNSICEMCKYHICKDMYLYSAEIELVAENYDKARELVQIGRDADHGEESLAFCDAYLRIKGELQ